MFFGRKKTIELTSSDITALRLFQEAVDWITRPTIEIFWIPYEGLRFPVDENERADVILMDVPKQSRVRQINLRKETYRDNSGLLQYTIGGLLTGNNNLKNCYITLFINIQSKGCGEWYLYGEMQRLTIRDNDTALYLRWSADKPILYATSGGWEIPKIGMVVLNKH